MEELVLCLVYLLWDKNQPVITGILSGLGARLAKDDYKDSKDWFSFKKREIM